MSLEEPNELRARLGLKPLRVESAEKTVLLIAKAIPIKEDETVTKEKEEQKRLAESISTGGGVLDVFGESGSTEDWLVRQKKKLRETTEEPDDSESSSISSDDESSESSDSEN